MFGKRGQEGVTLGTLLLIILGVVVVVVIIMGATGSLNFVFDKIGLAPGQNLEAKTQSCIIAAKSNLRADYCDTFSKIKIAGQTQYINCDNGQIKKNLGEEVPPLDCKNLDNAAEKSYCIQLIKGQDADSNTVVNDYRCATNVACSDLNGIPINKNEPCSRETPKKLLKGFKEVIEDRACCIA